MNPQLFGRYLLLDKVAAGGMAEVWRAKISGEGNFQKIVAIKKILPHVSEDEDFVAMFTDEANITSTMNHANIGQVTEFSKIGDTYYILMEYVSGKDMKSVWQWSKARGQIPPVELSAYMISKMCDGLDYAHQRGIVHRDISPQNVLLSWEGDVKVIDFGIAKATEKSGKTRPGTLKGKFAYMAPEQIRGLPLDGRSDIFAIGVCLYEMVTGQRGFQAESEFSLLEMVRNVEIRPPSLLNATLPAELERIIYKAMAKDRDQRYQTGSDMSVDIQQFLLQRGRPPQARDLAAFLRENFTVDWEKEKARLESYKEINPSEFTSPPRSNAGVPSAPVGQLDSDVFGGDGSDAFASFDEPAVPPGPLGPEIKPGVPPPAFITNSKGIPALRPEQTGSTAPNLSMPDEASSSLPKAPSKLPKRIAAAVVGIAAIAGVGVALRMTVLQPVTNVVVTIQGAKEATVRFDALPPLLAAPTVSIDKVHNGTHTVFVEAKGYVPVTLPVVTDGKQALFPLTVNMKRVPGKLTVVSEPAGAAITLDGQATGKTTPSTFELDGESIHEIVVAKEGYKPVSKADVRVPGNEESSVRLTMRPTMIKVRVVSTPEGAMLKVGEVDYGLTPVVIERSPEDPYPQITLTAKGCETMQTTMPFDKEKAEDRFDVTLKCRK